jgi:hypothetical protein
VLAYPAPVVPSCTNGGAIQIQPDPEDGAPLDTQPYAISAWLTLAGLDE